MPLLLPFLHVKRMVSCQEGGSEILFLVHRGRVSQPISMESCGALLMSSGAVVATFVRSCVCACVRKRANCAYFIFCKTEWVPAWPYLRPNRCKSLPPFVGYPRSFASPIIPVWKQQNRVYKKRRMEKMCVSGVMDNADAGTKRRSRDMYKNVAILGLVEATVWILYVVFLTHRPLLEFPTLITLLRRTIE